jgi:hypothetical protein
MRLYLAIITNTFSTVHAPKYLTRLNFVNFYRSFPLFSPCLGPIVLLPRKVGLLLNREPSRSQLYPLNILCPQGHKIVE